MIWVVWIAVVWLAVQLLPLGLALIWYFGLRDGSKALYTQVRRRNEWTE